MRRIEFKNWYFIVWSWRAVRYIGMLIGLEKAMAAALWPFLFIRPDLQKDRVLPELINHEKIHLKQQVELLLIFAELLYLFEYLYARFVKRMSARDAYYWTSMEQEAHRNATNFNYLKERKPYALLKYMKNKKHLSRDSEDNLIVRDY